MMECHFIHPSCWRSHFSTGGFYSAVFIVVVTVIITSRSGVGQDLPGGTEGPRPGICPDASSVGCSDVGSKCKHDSQCTGSQKCCECQSHGVLDCTNALPRSQPVTCDDKLVGDTKTRNKENCTETCECVELNGRGQWECHCPHPGVCPSENYITNCDNKQCEHDEVCEQYQKCCQADACAKTLCVDIQSNSQGGCTVNNNYHPVGSTLDPRDSALDKRCNYCKCESNERLTCTTIQPCFTSEPEQPPTGTTTPGNGGGILIIPSLLLMMISTFLGVVCL